MSIKCPSCRKYYKYPESFEKHLEESHPLIAPVSIARQTAKVLPSHDESSEEPHESLQWNGDDDIDTLTTENINHKMDSYQESEADFNMIDMGPDIRGMTTCYVGAASSYTVSESYKED